MMWTLFDSLVFLSGFTLCWLVKDTIRAWIVGPEQTAIDFRAGLNEILVEAKKGIKP